MNILIKLTCLIGLVIAPILGGHSNANSHSEEIRKEVRVEIKGDTSEMAAATITTATTMNGKTTTSTQEIEGTVEEIEEKANEVGTIVSVNIQKDTKKE
jgi:K(+)-stimulated pyrophosphate-energized sodium pump